MEINSAVQSQIQSVRSAIGMSTLQTAMSQDGATVNKLIESMQETSQEVQKAAADHKGNFINSRVY
ncbi:MAG: hypothetical protein ACQEQH_02405 [Bacillota bacterium]